MVIMPASARLPSSFFSSTIFPTHIYLTSHGYRQWLHQTHSQASRAICWTSLLVLSW
jgi:hypothetical protein